MAIIQSTIRVGQKPTKEELKRIRAEYKEAKKHPVNYTEDCPASTPEALAEFAAMARARKQKRIFVGLRLKEKALEKYKSLGKGYTTIMSEILNYAADDPEILAKIARN